MIAAKKRLLELLVEHGPMTGLDLVVRSRGDLDRGLACVYLGELEDAGMVASQVASDGVRRLYRAVLGVPLADTWVYRIVSVRGAMHGDAQTREVTYDIVRVKLYHHTHKAWIVSRRTDRDGEIVEWTAYDPPERTRITAREEADVMRSMQSEVACA